MATARSAISTGFDMLEQVAETWLINNRVNLQLLRELPPEGFAATLSTRGARGVGAQLVHVLDVRRWKLEAADKALAAGLPSPKRDDGEDRDLLIDAFEQSGEAIATLIRSCDPATGKVKGFKRGIVAFVGYLIAHESHHRGHALLTLKQCKIRRPESLKMGLWGWNKL